MHTIFGVATTSAKLEALLSSLEANAIPLQDITVVMPGDPNQLVPAEAARAEPVADDFSGNPRRAAMGGAIGALVGMGVMAVSVFPALTDPPAKKGVRRFSSGQLSCSGRGWRSMRASSSR